MLVMGVHQRVELEAYSAGGRMFESNGGRMFESNGLFQRKGPWKFGWEC